MHFCNACFFLSGVYTMIHVRRTCTAYRCTDYMYHNVKKHLSHVHVRCFKHENNVHVRRAGYSEHVRHSGRRTCTPYMYHSVNTVLNRVSWPFCAYLLSVNRVRFSVAVQPITRKYLSSVT